MKHMVCLARLSLRKKFTKKFLRILRSRTSSAIHFSNHGAMITFSTNKKGQNVVKFYVGNGFLKLAYIVLVIM